MIEMECHQAFDDARERSIEVAQLIDRAIETVGIFLERNFRVFGLLLGENPIQVLANPICCSDLSNATRR